MKHDTCYSTAVTTSWAEVMLHLNLCRELLKCRADGLRFYYIEEFKCYGQIYLHTCYRNLHLAHLGIFIAACSFCLGRLHESATRWSIHSRVLWDKQDLHLHSNTSHWCHYHKSDVFWICRTQKVMEWENRLLQVFFDKFIQDSLTGATPKGFILPDEDEWGRFFIFAVVASFPECVNAFALVVRPPTEQENLLFSFQLTGEETVKSAWLWTLCRHVANTICRADAVSPNTQNLQNFPGIQTSELTEWPSP